MKQIYKTISVLGLCLILVSSAFANDKIALAIKSRGDTKLKRYNEQDFKEKLKVGSNLFVDDKVKTEKDGYAVVIFLDDKSQLKIREDSEMIISGKIANGAISKQINMDYGTLKADVNPQKKGEFVIATPTSVASVKGTSFWIESDPVAGDQFFGLEGSVQVVNNESGKTIVVGANQTGTSTPEGDVEVKQTEEGAAPVDPEEEEGEEGEEEILNSIRIQFQNEQGEIKTLNIEY